MKYRTEWLWSNWHPPAIQWFESLRDAKAKAKREGGRVYDRNNNLIYPAARKA